MPSTLAPALAGLGLGIALASAPGPVQAVLLGEAIRGGLGRGFRAMAGANVTFGLLMVALALGVSLAPPSEPVLRILEVAGGALLLWLALEGFRATRDLDPTSLERRGLPPSARGALAVILNPGAWLFLATAASSLLSTAARQAGTGGALLATAALMLGLAIGDGGVVLLGGVGVRRGGERLGLWVRRILAIVLAGLGLWLLVQGLVG
jgi:threonine/homoserine/homoserine lactone efflux protein